MQKNTCGHVINILEISDQIELTLSNKYKCLWGVGGKGWVQTSRREIHTYIHLDYVKVEFSSCKTFF